jgi:hypothetical protein
MSMLVDQAERLQDKVFSCQKIIQILNKLKRLLKISIAIKKYKRELKSKHHKLNLISR